MVLIGQLAIGVDSGPFKLGLQQMRAELDRFARDARKAVDPLRTGTAFGFGRQFDSRGRLLPPRGPNGQFVPVRGFGGGAAAFAGAGGIPTGGSGFASAGTVGAAPSRFSTAATSFGAARVGSGAGLGGLGGIAGLAAGFGAVAGIRGAISTMAEFETSIAKIGGTTQQTGAQLERFALLAREVGESTVFSATEVADALLTLTRQGRTFDQQEAAIRPLLQFAQASEQTLAEAAQGASDIATQFRIPFEDIGKVTDLVSAAASRSSTDVKEMTRAFADAGSVLSSFGADAEEAATILQILADAGIRGSRAGIAVRNITLRNREQIDRDGVSGFVASLAGKSTNELAELVDTRAIPALINLSRGFDQFDAKLAENRNAVDGFTSALSGAVDETLGAAGKRFGSALDEFSLSLDKAFGITDTLADGLDGLSSAVGSVSRAIRLRTIEEETAARQIAQQRARAGVTGSSTPTIGQSFATGASTAAAGFGAFFRAIGIDTGTPRSNGPRQLGFADELDQIVADQNRAQRGRAPTTVVTGSYGYLERFQDNAAGIFSRAPSNASGIIDSLEQERRSLQLSGAAREAYNASVAAGMNVRGQEIASIRSYVEEIRALERQDRVFDSIAQGVASLGEEFIFAADSIEESAQRIFEAIARIGLQQGALQPLADVVRGAFSGFGGTARQQGAGGSYVVSGGGGHVAGGGGY